MPEMDWQTLVVLPIIVIAAAILVRSTCRFFAGEKVGGCGSECGACPASDKSDTDGLQQKAFVSIDVLDQDWNKVG